MIHPVRATRTGGLRRSGQLLALCLLMLRGFPAAIAQERESDSLRVSIRPGKVFPDQVYRLDLEASEGSLDERFLSWAASAGEILSDGETTAYWQSPSEAGRVKITVAALNARGTATPRRAERVLEVERPSTEGMVLVPAGTTVMGDIWTDTSDPYFTATIQSMVDKPAHRVYLDAFWCDRHRVTHRQYAAFLESARAEGLCRLTPEAVIGWHQGVEVPFYYFELKRPRSPVTLVPPLERGIRRDGQKLRVRPEKADHAVMDVTWAGARAYAHYHGKRLLGEAEWERAARGSDQRIFPWGDELPTPYHADINFYFGNDGRPVGSFSPVGDSPFGVADLLGSFEWVEDWYGIEYYRDGYSDLPLHNPTGPEWGIDHPARGLSRMTTFNGNDEYLAPLAFRYQWVFEFGYGHLFAHNETGFRCALSARLDEKGAAASRPRPDADLPLRSEGLFPLPRTGGGYEY